MNCRSCGTALPEGAMFCGECGRPVASSGRRRATIPPVVFGDRGAAPLAVAVEEAPSRSVAVGELPRYAPAASMPGSLREPAETDPVVVELESVPPLAATTGPLRIAEAGVLASAPPALVVEDHLICPQCGRTVLPADVFCGDCGFVLGTPSLGTAARGADDLAPGDLQFTGIVVHTAPRDHAGIPLVGDPEPVVAEEPVAAEEPLAEEPLSDEEEPRAEDVAGAEPEAEPVAEEPEVVEDVEITEIAGQAEDDEVAEPEQPVAPATVDDEPQPAKPLRSVPDPFPWGKAPTGPAGPVDLEKTRAVASGTPEERFVLQFSTGESVTVTGAGLVGRNPSSQPGEFVDQLVTIFDAGKSVSKTHLEFGQDSGRFWVSDRYSTNGSTVRQPDMEPKRCDPGRRYFIARGTRVDIGEQFFVVS